MKEIKKNFLQEFFQQVEEFVLLKQKKFFEENQEYFPLLIYSEKDKKWEEVYFDKSGFRIKSIVSQYDPAFKYVDFIDIKNNIIGKMVEVEDYIALWKVADEFVSEKLQKLSVAIENVKLQLQKYNEEKEKNEIYSMYIRMKIEEKMTGGVK